MNKYEVIQSYYDYISEPEQLKYSHDSYRKKLGITEEDTINYREYLISQLSYKPSEKKNILIKETIKPLLKENGFSVGGNIWCKNISDMEKIVISVEGYRYSSVSAGAIFDFIISIFQGEGKAKPDRGRGDLQMNYRQFLPYFGMLSPFYSPLGYKIDGFRDYLPIDTPIDEISRQIGKDFSEYILPKLSNITSRDDYEKIYQELNIDKCLNKPEVKIIRLYERALRSFVMQAMGLDFDSLVTFANELNLSKEDILNHFDYLDIMRLQQDFTKIDAKPLLEKIASKV